MNVVRVETKSLEDERRMKMVEDVWNWHIGDRYHKTYDHRTCVTTYEVPREWERWWRGWFDGPRA